MDTDLTLTGMAPEPRDYRRISFAQDGSVIAIMSLIAESDADAITQTDALMREFAVDLWDGLRFVEHFVARLGQLGCLFAVACAVVHL